jgi:iron(III) transport system permease protein
MTGLLAAAFYLSGKFAPTMYSASLRRARPLPLARWRWPALAAVAALVALMAAVPLANLVYKAGVVVHADSSGFSRDWSIEKCLRIVATSPLRNAREFGWSLALSLLAATIGVVLAIPLAWWARRPGWPRWSTRLMIALCLATPGPMIGLAIIWLMNRRQWPWLIELYDHSLASPGLALLVRVLPLVVLVLLCALRSVPSETLEAAQLDGAGPWTRLLAIALPQRTPAVGVAWLVAFAVAMGDLAATILVVPPGVMTLANLLFDRLHGAQEDDVAGIALSLVLLFGAIALAASWLAAVWIRSLEREIGLRHAPHR